MSLKNDPMYETKFTVFNNKHLNCLTEQQIENLKDICTTMFHAGHLNDYLVINQDEPYAEKVWNIIKQHETKTIIAYVGRAGSGKDYQCSKLMEKGFVKMAFADALRKIIFLTLGMSYEEGMKQYEDLKRTPLYNGQTLRHMLEHLGTEGIRHYDNDFWANALVKTIQESNEKKICISDLRFPNEFKALHDLAQQNGYAFTCIFCDYHSERYQEENTHASAAMSNYFVQQGFKDLQEITKKDVATYLIDSQYNKEKVDSL